MLEVRKIDAGYGDVQVLFSLSLEVKEKEIVTLLGSNGAGKTTTLRCICGVVRPRQGEVLFKGRPVSKEAARIGVVARVLRHGKSLSYGDVEFRSEDGKLAAHATTTYALL